MSRQDSTERCCRAGRWSSQVYGETRTSSSRGGLREVAVRWRFFVPGWRSQSQRLTLAWRKGKESQRKKSKSRAEAFHQPRCWCETKGKAVERRASCKITADRHQRGGGGRGVSFGGSRHTTLYEGRPAASHSQHRRARTALGTTLDAFVAKTKSSTKIPYLWAIDGAAAGR